MSSLDAILAGNRRWAAGVRQSDPQFFERLAVQQAPRYMWIGCADSRVPATEICGLAPGEIFVHRNVANVVVHTDLNCLSVLQYAVEVLHVEHVIVCGHYGCGGIQAAYQRNTLGLIDNWLRHVQDVAVRHRDVIAASRDDEDRIDRLCELNVIDGVTNVARSTILQEAWRRGQPVTLHGLVYGLADGLLHDIGIEAQSMAKLNQDYVAAVQRLATRGVAKGSA